MQREVDSLTDLQDSLHLASHSENNLEDLNDSDQSNEAQTSQLLDDSSLESPTRCYSNLNDETNSRSHEESTNVHKTTRVKVIGPHNLTLITSNLDSIHILPYS
ncbi:hypothetical protein O181_056412 [Austropuccinia psidii MF-1]|uniref:Uncharacterized protein n=1 Tax=Austropuccinia psidii MF-1 TaxID=1389203 RepID=A0A9Q3EAR2_9BASI|nr:hypothetical protein [Austropuccinia psidii MF-1]